MKENEELNASVSTHNSVRCNHGYVNLPSSDLGVESLMANQEENDRQAAETNRIGAEGNRIGAETDRAAAETTRVDAHTARAESDKRIHNHRVQKDVGQLVAYLLIVTMGVIGFWSLDRANERLDKQDLIICQTAAENRAAIRNLAIAIEVLGSSLIVGDKPESKWTPREQVSMSRLDEFHRTTSKMLSAPVCPNVD